MPMLPREYGSLNHFPESNRESTNKKNIKSIKFEILKQKKLYEDYTLNSK